MTRGWEAVCVCVWGGGGEMGAGVEAFTQRKCVP